MQMPARKYEPVVPYRYGFNGKENDNEVKGEGNQQDYGMRIYEPRLGRFLSVDATMSDYPELTPFQFSSNNPIFNVDLDGLEGRPWYTYDQKYNQLVIDKAPAFYKNTFTGFFKSAWNTVKTVALLASPVLSSYKMEQNEAILQSITHPRKTFSSTKSAINQWGKNLMSSDPAVAGNAFGQGLEFGAEFIASGAMLKSTTTAATLGKLLLPQGILAEEFQVMSQRIVSAVGSISDDIVVQGSRASGTATIVSDIDIALKVGEKEFDQLILKAFGTPNKGSALEKTMNNAIKTGKIQAGEAGLSGLRKNLEKLLGMKTDISIIKRGGAFDNGVQIPIKGSKAR
jgi:RHS repeat-associated protein